MKKPSHMSTLIKSSRMKKNMSQNDLRKLLGYKSPQFISNWERGIADPPMKTLVALSKHLGFTKKDVVSALNEDLKALVDQHFDKKEKKHKKIMNTRKKRRSSTVSKVKKAA